MPDYQKLYTLLFNAITDAERELIAHHYDLALSTLFRAQLDAEELYLSGADAGNEPPKR